MKHYLWLLALLAACGTDPNPSGGGDSIVGIPSLGVPGTAPGTSTEPAMPPIPTLPADDTLRINEIQMKGSHNSFHVASDAQNAPGWSQYTLPPLSEQLDKHGVRQFELDIHYYDGIFLVFHLPGIDPRSNCPTLKACLAEMLQWSRVHPGHHPIVVWLEFKDEWDPLKIAPNIEALEAEVRAAIPRDRLLTPDDVRHGYPTLTQAVYERGWPTLGEARGKFMFVVMDEQAGRYAYTRQGKSLDGRAMFVTAQGGSYGVIAMIDDLANLKDAIYQAAKAGMLVRSRVDDLPTKSADYNAQLTIALNSGAHMIATDYPVDYTIPDYAVRIPGGTPSRCNPVTARSFCHSLLIENPALLDGIP